MSGDQYTKSDNKSEEYLVSEEVIRSLQSVKHDCLIALDSLLKCIVVSAPATTTTATTTTTTEQPPPPGYFDGTVRRKSDSALLPNHRLLGSIAHSTQRISQLGTPTSSITMVRSESVPLDMTMSDIRRILYSQHQLFSLLDRSKEYHLCYALAALLCNVYRVLEFTSNDIEQENDLFSKKEEEQEDYYDDDDDDDDDDDVVVDHIKSSNNNNVYQRLREKVSIFRNRDIVSIPTQPTDELTDLWHEMDQLMDVVYCLGYEKCYAPPAYHTRDEEEEEEELLPPPPYVSEKTQLDLDNLFSAIDRLSQVVPRLNNQRVDMTERQANELAAASIGKIVDRLSLGRMNDQRATLPITTTTPLKPNKDHMLRDLIIQICHTTSRSLDNQRVPLDSRLQRKMDHASMHGLLDRLERGRMVDQEWKSPPDESLSMMDNVVKSLSRPRFSKQRFQMTSTKERNMFMSDLLHKVDKLEGRRMKNQDACIRKRCPTMNTIVPVSPPLTPTDNIEEDEEIFDLFDHMAKLQLSDQRAVYKGPTITSATLTTTTTTTCLA